ncbi:CAAX prenyl protease-related protein [Rubritalea spongiae]|uniref:CAAX prenyl protease-related protein n=1 Tax=Rubritalea spongiae TaxID=430797 RepID=A0ABW5E2L2_9BACT
MTLHSIRESKTYAHVVPFAAFLILNLLMQVANESGLEWAHPDAPWWREWPEQWMYPLQTILIAGLLGFFWKHYDFKPARGLLLATVLGIVGIGLWILPTHLFDVLGYTEDNVGFLEHLGLMPRRDGFNPSELEVEFGAIGVWTSTIFRFLRAVVIVSLVEEIFWRGFLMRFIIDPDGNYWKKPFGEFHWKSYLIVTACFMGIHAPVDYVGAFFFGSLMYFLAVKTKSLTACVLMHAVANLIMGMYALQFGKYGLW